MGSLRQFGNVLNRRPQRLQQISLLHTAVTVTTGGHHAHGYVTLRNGYGLTTKQLTKYRSEHLVGPNEHGAVRQSVQECQIAGDIKHVINSLPKHTDFIPLSI